MNHNHGVDKNIIKPFVWKTPSIQIDYQKNYLKKNISRLAWSLQEFTLNKNQELILVEFFS